MKCVQILKISSIINFDSFVFLEICQNIEALSLYGHFSNINLDGFVNLKRLKLCGELSDYFNYFDIFKNICDRLEEVNQIQQYGR